MNRTSTGPAVTGLAVALCMLLGLALAPAASASFSAVSQAGTSVSTASLPTPSTTTVSLTGTCNTNKRTVTVVLGATGPLPHANALRITADGSKTWKDQPLTGFENHQFTTVQGGKEVAFVVEVRAIYKVPGDTNAWSSPPLIRTFICA